MIQRHLFAIGDNGFRKDPTNPHLIRYLLKTAGKECPKICVIPTASGDQQAYVDDFRATFGKEKCEITVLSLFRGEIENWKTMILEQDLVYITGGNTRNMLVLWKEWGLDLVIKEAYEKGIVMAGGSAGGVCWFQECVTDSVPGKLTVMKCLGYLPTSMCPHYDGEINRRPAYHAHLKSGAIGPGIAAENGVALHYVNEQLTEVVSAYSGKFAYTVALDRGEVSETPIPARDLSAAHS
jgi:dipeptidase E